MRLSETGNDGKGMCFLPDSELRSPLSHQVLSEDAGPAEKGERGAWGWHVDRRGHSRESNFQAMVMPPISESLKRSRKVPSGLLMSRSWACCLFTKPRMALGARNIRCHRWACSRCPKPAPSQPPARHSSPVVPMGLVMLLQHLHDPVKPLPEGVVPARQVLLRTPQHPTSALVLIRTLSQFPALLSHSPAVHQRTRSQPLCQGTGESARLWSETQRP